MVVVPEVIGVHVVPSQQAESPTRAPFSKHTVPEARHDATVGAGAGGGGGVVVVHPSLLTS